MASAHGIYRGGLAVHLAKVAMGGNLGMKVDLAQVPLRDVEREDVLLFSESAGRFIVTVDPVNREAFEDLFKGLACACIGTVTEEPELVVRGIEAYHHLSVRFRLDEILEDRPGKRPFGESGIVLQMTGGLICVI